MLARAMGGAEGLERSAFAAELVEIAAFDPAAIRGLGRRKAIEAARSAQTAAVRALAEHWVEIPRPLRPLALAACRGRWGHVATGLEISGPVAASIAELALDTADPVWTALLAPLLGSGESHASSAAAQALLALAIRVAPEPADPAMLGVDARAPALRPILDAAAEAWTAEQFMDLHRAVHGALDSFEHHRRKEALLAGLLLLERPPRPCQTTNGPLVAAARGERGGASEALRTAFRRARAPIARQRAWLWLREEGVAAACIDRLARAPSLLDHAVVLRLGHLALAPARARQAALVPIATRPTPGDRLPPGAAPGGRRLHPEGPVPDRAALGQLDVVARRQVARLAASLMPDAAALALALDPLLIDPDGLVRLGAMRVLPGIDAARDFCFDGSAAVAGAAATRATSCGLGESGRLRAGDAARRRFARSLLRSPHSRVRRMGEEETARLTPGAGSPAARLAARRALESDPSGFVDWVRDTVRGGETAAGVAALMTSRRIGAAGAVEPLLLAVVRDSLASDLIDSRLTATAIACPRGYSLAAQHRCAGGVSGATPRFSGAGERG
ncbi:MAG: hypothetical protein IPJ41_11425 [Phycisphaerales bacterium]|nr:hypothetical protein [Phycisphaerales bacterium]